MLSALILGGVLVAAGPGEDQTEAAYQAAKAQVGRDPQAQVKLALWCEAHGLDAERLKHLAMAVLADPTNSTARGLLGLVSFQGRWQKPEAVAEKVKNDEELARTLAEYNEKRAKAANTADAQWDLALWCEQHGLKAEAFAHLATVVRLDPGREPAWKRLGYKKHNGRWVTDEQLAAAKAEVEAQKKADRHWKPLLEKWKGWLGEKNKKDEAEKLLAGVSDPRAVPAVWLVFVATSAGDQAKAVQILGQIDAPGATRALALLAVFGQKADVRRLATETLKNRDPRDYASLLIGLMQDRIKYEVRPVGGPGSPGVLFVEGKQFNTQRVYAPPPGPRMPYNASYIGNDYFGLPVVGVPMGEFFVRSTNAQTIAQAQQGAAQIEGFSRSLTSQGPTGAEIAKAFAPFTSAYENFFNSVATAGANLRSGRRVEIEYPVTLQIPVGRMTLEAQKSAMAAQMQLQSDVDRIKDLDDKIKERNERVSEVLNTATGEDLGQDRKAWQKWWVDLQGYAYNEPPQPDKPTLVQNVPLTYVPQAVPSVATLGLANGFRISHSCFAAGTLVRSLVGNAPIESIKAGDQVLSQNTTTGALSYQPVVVVYHNPPNQTLRIDLGTEEIVATGIHRFWKAGKGWVMARDLKPGDPIRTLGGIAKVASVEPASVQPVFNLEVAEGQSFLVGQQGALVHDNSLVLPALHPFDAEPQLPALTTARAD